MKPIALAALFAAGMIACSDSTAANNNGFFVVQDVGVEVHDNAFDPSTITVRAGHHVTWVWKNKTALHSLHFLGDVKAAQPPSDSTAIYDRAFATPGIYYYYCDIHGAASGLSVSGMSGKVEVTQ